MKKHFWVYIIVLPFLALGLGCTKSPTSPGLGQWGEATAKAFSSGRYGLAGTVFKGQMWAIGGASGSADGSVTYYYSDVYFSGNGAHWTTANTNAPFGGRYGSQVLSYNGMLWLIGGNSNGILMNDVWNSTDGNTWTQVLASTNSTTPTQFSPREDFCALVYNNAMWVIGGYSNGKSDNDVWSSTDGINWTQVLGNNANPGASQFAARWGLVGVVYNNLMWIMEGAYSLTANSDPTIAYGDVWNSNNGNTWSLVSNLQMNRTYFDQLAVNANNQMFLTTGELWNDWGPQDATFTSSNGINWSSAYGKYPIRFGHLSLSYNNDVWVIGGCDDICTSNPCPTTVTYYNDVWYTR